MSDEITIESLAAKLEELSQEITSLKEENAKLGQEDKVNQAIKNHAQILLAHQLVPQGVWDDYTSEISENSPKNSERRLSASGSISIDEIKLLNKVT